MQSRKRVHKEDHGQTEIVGSCTPTWISIDRHRLILVQWCLAYCSRHYTCTPRLAGRIDRNHGGKKCDDGVTRGRGEALRCTTRVLCTGWMGIVKRRAQLVGSSEAQCDRQLTAKLGACVPQVSGAILPCEVWWWCA